MHILHLYKDYYPVLGGIENHLRLLAREQARRGHRVTVLASARRLRGHAWQDDGVEVLMPGRLATVARAPLSPGWVRLVARLRPDVAHLHFPYPVGEMAYLTLGRAPVEVMTYHSDIIRQRFLKRVYGPILKRLLERLDALIATSARYAETSPVLSRYAHKVRAIPLGIDPGPILEADRERVQAFRERFPGPRLLFAGKLRYYKGLPLLFEALQGLEARLIVIGSGPRDAAWRRLSLEMGLGERVHFLGEVPEVELHAAYHAADLFVLPASQRSEAFGAVLLEAAVAGLPAVTTEIGTGTSVVVRHGQSGLVVPPEPGALAEAIRALLEDPTRRRAMGQAARERALREFTIASVAERIERLYQEVGAR